MGKYQHASAVAASAAHHVTRAAKAHTSAAHVTVALAAHHAKAAAQAASAGSFGHQVSSAWALIIGVALLIAALFWPRNSTN